MRSPGKCNFENHLQPKHHHGAAWELFSEDGVQTSNYTNMHINIHLHANACRHAPVHTHRQLGARSCGMNSPDDAWLVIIRLRMKIDWAPRASERTALSSFAFFVCVFLL